MTGFFLTGLAALLREPLRPPARAGVVRDGAFDDGAGDQPSSKALGIDVRLVGRVTGPVAGPKCSPSERPAEA